MIRLYTDDDLWEAYAQRRRILAVLFAVTGGWFLAILGLFIYYVMLPYADPNQTWVTVVSGIITALYIIFLFPYMGICFKRSNAYCKMLKFISLGLKESAVLPFAGIDDWLTHDGVDVNVANFQVRNIKRDEEMIRQIYVDGEKDFPPFEEGQQVRIVSQGNLLIEYEILSQDKEKQLCVQS